QSTYTYLIASGRQKPARYPLFPYTTLFRSDEVEDQRFVRVGHGRSPLRMRRRWAPVAPSSPRRQQPAALQHVEAGDGGDDVAGRSEEHTSELQSRENLVCRLLLEKKKKKKR